jgi:hypothetical protein
MRFLARDRALRRTIGPIGEVTGPDRPLTYRDPWGPS